jgi:hypothetical protein
METPEDVLAGSVRRCCSSHSGRIQLAHCRRLEKYQSASCWASSRTCHEKCDVSQPAVLMQITRLRGRLLVAPAIERAPKTTAGCEIRRVTCTLAEAKDNA